MADWLKSMQQTFEYYIVDPGTWKDIRILDSVKSASITRDSEVETLGSATFDIVDTLGEEYIRVYLITIQNGVREKHPLGTFLMQTPSSSFDGKMLTVSVDAYTPLIELKENLPPLGYSILEDAETPPNNDILESAYLLTRENLRAPVSRAKSDNVPAESGKKLYSDFVANPDDTWLSFLVDLLANAKYTFGLDEMGRVLFLPNQDAASLQPVWTYDDSNSSILYPEISMNHDLYGIPNVVEVVYSKSGRSYHGRAVNDDPNSPLSTIKRGREIVHRVTDPNFGGIPAGPDQIQKYAEKLLSELSSVEYTVTYTHGYCPVRLGDCVRLNYDRAGFSNVKAKVISQTIKCEPGCPVTEKAIFTNKLWR